MAMGRRGAIYVMNICLVVCAALWIQTAWAGKLTKKMLPEPCCDMVLYVHVTMDNPATSKDGINVTHYGGGGGAGGGGDGGGGGGGYGDGGGGTPPSSGQGLGGAVAVFENLVRLESSDHAMPVGSASGFYCADVDNTFVPWLGFTITLNCTDYDGSLTLGGGDKNLANSENSDGISVAILGGTGDFVMARGIAEIRTDAYQVNSFFSVRVGITLYECY